MIHSFYQPALICSVVVVIGILCGSGSLAHAQNINVTTPFTSINDSFYENHGVNFGFSIPGGRGNGSQVVGLGPQGQLLPNLVFFQNGFGGAIPQFGGYTPNSGANFGFGTRGPNGGGFSLGFNLAKGSTRTSTTVAPSLTVQNGFGGSLINGQTRPFVTGVVPVIGGGVPGFNNVTPAYGFNPGYQDSIPMDNGVTRALQSGQLDLRSEPDPVPHELAAPVTFSNAQSTALSGDLSVAAIKAERQRMLAARKLQFDSTIEEAKQLVAAEKYAEARIKYKEASKLTDDKSVQDQIKRWIKASRLH